MRDTPHCWTDLGSITSSVQDVNLISWRGYYEVTSFLNFSLPSNKWTLHYCDKEAPSVLVNNLRLVVQPMKLTPQLQLPHDNIDHLIDMLIISTWIIVV